MAWTTPPTFTDGSVLTGAQLNILRDDLNESAAAKATAAGQLFVSTGVNAIAARTPATLTVTTGVETTTSTTFVNTLTTPGPAVTCTTGTKAIVFVTAICRCGTAAISSHASYAVSGATTIAADDQWGCYFMGGSANSSSRISAASMLVLTAGSNTFTMNYKSGGAATAGFDARTIIVIPL